MTREEQTQDTFQKLRKIADKDTTIFTLFTHTSFPKKDTLDDTSDENFGFYFDEEEIKTTDKKE